MINISQKYAQKLNLKFGTDLNPEKSKTKCLAFTKSRRAAAPMKDITLDGYALPWVKQVKHLGHTLQTDNSMKIDICLKRGAYIGKVNSILQEFYYADSSVLMKLIGSYCCSMYGSNVWDLFSPESQKLYRSYNVTLRTVYGLPRTTHKYLLERISDTPLLFLQLLARYVTFTK